jgi:hypothetical protein
MVPHTPIGQTIKSSCARTRHIVGAQRPAVMITFVDLASPLRSYEECN